HDATAGNADAGNLSDLYFYTMPALSAGSPPVLRATITSAGNFTVGNAAQFSVDPTGATTATAISGTSITATGTGQFLTPLGRVQVGEIVNDAGADIEANNSGNINATAGYEINGTTALTAT